MKKSQNTSDGSLKKKTSLVLRKAPDVKHVAAGRKLAQQYSLVMRRASKGFFGYSIELPGVIGEGTTYEKCAQDTLDATAMAIAVMLELGHKPPVPASEGRREVQLNLRLTASEKMQIEEAAHRAGYRSVSDFMRVSALRHAS